MYNRPTHLSPLEYALPKNRRVTPLECALTKTKDLKSFRIRTYEKTPGGGGVLLTKHPARMRVPRSAATRDLSSCSARMRVPPPPAPHRFAGGSPRPQLSFCTPLHYNPPEFPA